MTDRLVAEACFDREQAARSAYQDAVTTAGITRRAARDAAYLERDREFDALRSVRTHLLHTLPRDEAALAIVEQQMKDWRKNPLVPDTSAAEAEYEAACALADHELKETLRRVFRDRIYGVSR
jgi:hypothetical protein